MNTLNNKLAGILLKKKVIDTNYTADPGDGFLTGKEIVECIEKNPRLLEPFLMLAAHDDNFFNEDEVPKDMLRFIQDLRDLNPNGQDYKYAEYRKVLENYRFHIKHIVPKYFKKD